MESHSELVCREVASCRKENFILKTEMGEIKAVQEILLNNDKLNRCEIKRLKSESLRLTSELKKLRGNLKVTSNSLNMPQISSKNPLISVVEGPDRAHSVESDLKEKADSSSSSMRMQANQTQKKSEQNMSKSNPILENLDQQLFDSIEMLTAHTFRTERKVNRFFEGVQSVNTHHQVTIDEWKCSSNIEVCSSIQEDIEAQSNYTEENRFEHPRNTCPNPECLEDVLIVTDTQQMKCERCFEVFCQQHFPQKATQCGCF